MVSCIFSIDATESSRFGKYVNDSPAKFANCRTKTLYVDDIPHLVLFASKPILPGTELRYDYGSGNDLLPWRKVECILVPYESDFHRTSTLTCCEVILQDLFPFFLSVCHKPVALW